MKLLSFFSRLNAKRYFLNANKGFAPILVILAIALLAIPVTTVLVQQQQDIRQRAAPNDYTLCSNSGMVKYTCDNNNIYEIVYSGTSNQLFHECLNNTCAKLNNNCVGCKNSEGTTTITNCSEGLVQYYCRNNNIYKENLSVASFTLKDECQSPKTCIETNNCASCASPTPAPTATPTPTSPLCEVSGYKCTMECEDNNKRSDTYSTSCNEFYNRKGLICCNQRTPTPTLPSCQAKYENPGITCQQPADCIQGSINSAVETRCERVCCIQKPGTGAQAPTPIPAAGATAAPPPSARPPVASTPTPKPCKTACAQLDSYTENSSCGTGSKTWRRDQSGDNWCKANPDMAGRPTCWVCLDDAPAPVTGGTDFTKICGEKDIDTQKAYVEPRCANSKEEVKSGLGKFDLQKALQGEYCNMNYYDVYKCTDGSEDPREYAGAENPCRKTAWCPNVSVGPGTPIPTIDPSGYCPSSTNTCDTAECKPLKERAYTNTSYSDLADKACQNYYSDNRDYCCAIGLPAAVSTPVPNVTTAPVTTTAPGATTATPVPASGGAKGDPCIVNGQKPQSADSNGFCPLDKPVCNFSTLGISKTPIGDCVTPRSQFSFCTKNIACNSNQCVLQRGIKDPVTLQAMVPQPSQCQGQASCQELICVNFMDCRLACSNSSTDESYNCISSKCVYVGSGTAPTKAPTPTYYQNLPTPTALPNTTIGGLGQACDGTGHCNATLACMTAPPGITGTGCCPSAAYRFCPNTPDDPNTPENERCQTYDFTKCK